MSTMKKRGELDAKGELQMEIILNRFPWSVDEDFSECKLISRDDPCEEAFLKQICVRKHSRLTLRQVRKSIETRTIYSCLQFQNLVDNHRKYNECEEELNVTQSNEDGVKCVLRCVMIKMGHLDNDGALIGDGIKKRFRGVEDMDFGMCQSIKNDDECEEAHLKNMCVADSFVNSYFVQVWRSHFFDTALKWSYLSGLR